MAPNSSCDEVMTQLGVEVVAIGMAGIAVGSVNMVGDSAGIAEAIMIAAVAGIVVALLKAAYQCRAVAGATVACVPKSAVKIEPHLEQEDGFEGTPAIS